MSFRLPRRLGILLAVSLVFLAGQGIAAPRIVVVGDVHGDLASFRAILVEAGVVDATGAWVGGETVLVQLGDLVDRGPQVRGTLDFAMALEREAPRHGGRAVFLLGNHEVMNVTGDLRYVDPADYADFRDTRSEKRRADAWRKLRSLRKRRAERLGLPEPPSGAQARAAWLETHPPGYLERREAFGPGGRYGRWLRGRRATFSMQGTAFLHGGLAPELAGTPLEEIERRVHEELAAFDGDMRRFAAEGLILWFFDLGETSRAVSDELQALRASDAAAAGTGGPRTSAAGAERREVYERFLDRGSWTINAETGPLWFRGYGTWSDAEGAAAMPALLSAARVRRFVVGHSVRRDGRIAVRFDGAAFIVDTGMLTKDFPGGRASALELANGTATAIYVGEPRTVIWRPPEEVAPAPTATPASGTPGGGRSPAAGAR